jgi:hypothetical protein
MDTSARTLTRPGLLRQIRFLRRFFGQPHAALEEIYDSEGPVVQIGAGPTRLAILGDPVVIADMFAESTESFRWNHRFSTLSQWVGAKSLLTSDGRTPTAPPSCAGWLHPSSGQQLDSLDARGN